MPEQIAGVSFLVWLACVYALGLVAVGWGFDILAKRTSQRMVAARTFGFTYHEESDAWLCPEDQWLWATAFDSDNRVMRYRAKPSVCNTCPIKDSCTVSANGRELTREVDEWPYSESGRFHRGLAAGASGGGCRRGGLPLADLPAGCEAHAFPRELRERSEAYSRIHR